MALLGALAPAADARSRCKIAPDGKVIAKSRRSLVVKAPVSPPPGEPSRVTVCWRATGRTSEIAKAGWNSTDYNVVRALRLAGRFVAFGDEVQNLRHGSYYGSVVVWDVRAGRFASSDPGPSGGAGETEQYLAAVLLNQAGNLVYQIDSRREVPGVTVTPAISRIAARDAQGYRVLDEGPRGSLTGLRLRGNLVTWRRDGASRSIVLR